MKIDKNFYVMDYITVLCREMQCTVTGRVELGPKDLLRKSCSELGKKIERIQSSALCPFKFFMFVFGQVNGFLLRVFF